MGVVNLETVGTTSTPGETFFGTSYFESRKAAVEYFRAYTDDPETDVSDRLGRGEIHIGKPEVPTGMKLYIDRRERRYMLATVVA